MEAGKKLDEHIARIQDIRKAIKKLDGIKVITKEHRAKYLELHERYQQKDGELRKLVETIGEIPGEGEDYGPGEVENNLAYLDKILNNRRPMPERLFNEGVAIVVKGIKDDNRDLLDPAVKQLLYDYNTNGQKDKIEGLERDLTGANDQNRILEENLRMANEEIARLKSEVRPAARQMLSPLVQFSNTRKLLEEKNAEVKRHQEWRIEGLKERSDLQRALDFEERRTTRLNGQVAEMTRELEELRAAPADLEEKLKASVKRSKELIAQNKQRRIEAKTAIDTKDNEVKALEEEYKELEEAYNTLDEVSTSRIKLLRKVINNLEGDVFTKGERVNILESQSRDLVKKTKDLEVKANRIPGLESTINTQHQENGNLESQIVELSNENFQLVSERDSLKAANEIANREFTSLQSESEDDKKSLNGIIDSLKLDKERRIREIGILTKEKEAISGERDALFNEKGTLFEQNCTLVQEKGDLSKEKDSLVKEKDVLVEEKGALFKEKATLIQQNCALVQEKGALSEQKDTLNKEKDVWDEVNKTFAKEWDTLIGDKETLYKEKDVLVQENRTLTKERDTLVEDKATLIGEREKLINRNETLSKEISTLTQERDALVVEKDIISKERDTIIDKYAILLKEKTEVVTSLDTSKLANAALQSERNNIIKEKDALGLQLDGLLEEREVTIIKMDGLQGQNKTLNNTIKLMQESIEAKTKESAELKAKADELEAKVMTSMTQFSQGTDRLAQVLNGITTISSKGLFSWNQIVKKVMATGQVKVKIGKCQKLWTVKCSWVSTTKNFSGAFVNQMPMTHALVFLGLSGGNLHKVNRGLVLDLVSTLTQILAVTQNTIIGQLIVLGILNFQEWQEKPISEEWGMVAFAIFQLNNQLCQRFEGIWEGMNLEVAPSTLKDWAVKCHPAIGALFTIFETPSEIAKVLASEFLSNHIPLKDGIYVISARNWKWMIMVQESNLSLRLIDKTLISLSSSRTTISTWVYTVNLPKDFKEANISCYEERSIVWFKDNVSIWAPRLEPSELVIRLLRGESLVAELLR